MGRVKELIPEYIFDSGYDLDKYAFRCQLDELIENGLFEDKLPLREFLEEVMPHYGRHFIFITDDDGTVYATKKFGIETWFRKKLKSCKVL